MPGPTTPRNRLGFAFQSFTFGFDALRQRTTQVSGILSNYTATMPAFTPLTHYQAGDTDNTFDVMDGYDKGHVIMASCSNVSEPENVVAMYPCFNQAGGAWRELEQRIYNYVKESKTTATTPRSVHMKVDIEYTGHADPRFPTAFLVTVSDNRLPVYFKGAPLTNMRFTHLPTPPATVNPITEIGADKVHQIADTMAAIALSGWTIESVYPNAVLAPIATVPRPYAALDYLWLHAQDPWLCGFLDTAYRDGHAASFSERQKMLIRVMNAMRNGGFLRSDYAGDTTDNLIMGSGQRSAQVDHVYPYAGIGFGTTRFGGNLFSNALVASGAFNNRMKNATPAAKWGDRAGVALYGTARHL
jgi:hypothetical protein